MAKLLLNKVVIFGVGLIGGSFALALKRAGAVRHVVGFGRSEANLRLALKRGVIDEIGTTLPRALRDADVVLLAMPVGRMQQVMKRIAPHLSAHTIVTDAGSTKQDVVTCARKNFSKQLKNFVPAHPIAGTEHSGVRAATADLFQNRDLIVTPLKETDKKALRRVQDTWLVCGARISEMTPRQHDEVFAAVSHLPHLLAYGLVYVIAGKPNAKELFKYAAGGFRDFTRIAGSSPEMWRDIALANRKILLKELVEYQKQLKRVAALLQKGDGKALERLFTRARNARQKWLLKN
ncbi:MAG TPA: prephenate dehydrogenase/arogenate dehydrogenase family protein [Burkholderiales bacterium]|nr:prephenate dehydrogenase/arogenate dehydrogenase family protein [Burkholderiales bacterium]